MRTTASAGKPTRPGDVHGSIARVIRYARGVAAGLLVGYVALRGLRVGGALESDAVFHVVTGIFLIVAAGLCLARAGLVAGQRATWVMLCIGFASWGLGEIIFATGSPGAQEAFSAANVLSLAFYPTACVALILMLRAQLETFFTTLWLDGLAGALSMSAVVAAFLFPPVLANTGGSALTVLGAISYPLADLMLVAFVFFALAMTGWRPGAVLGCALAAFVVVAVTDAYSLWSAATSNSPRTELDWLWPAAALGVAEVGWRTALPTPRLSNTSLRLLLFPMVVSLTALGVLLSGLVQDLHVAGYELATSSLLLIVVRLALTVSDNLRMAEASRQEALTDALTGLGNRRKLMLDVEAALEQGADPAVLLVFDLDGFKGYNDTFGHPAGDALLARLGPALAEAVSGSGTAYRPGGDEFCALLRTGASDLSAHLDRTVAALSERGKGFAVTPSYGSVVIPEETLDVTVALQLADKRLYEQKGDRRGSRDGAQARDVLVRALRERNPGLEDRLSVIGSLARAVAQRFELTTAEVDEVTRAAELHDIGKMAVPDAILEKRSPLDERELEMVRHHTVVGERILTVAPALRSIGRLVRSSHECWDGSGYPDRLAGDEIPLGARIVAVCDAFDAMIMDRPNQPAVSRQEAFEELRRCAGSQFDPKVVEIFCGEAEAVLHGIDDPLKSADSDPRFESLVVRAAEKSLSSSR